MKNRPINYLELGGTLFIPATHKDLKAVVSGAKYPTLRSVVIDTEDSISQDELPHAISCVYELLNEFAKSSVLVFLRPRNIDVLQDFLLCVNIDKVDGFILPKFSLDNADTYLELLNKYPHVPERSDKYSWGANIMPSIEGKELFERNKLLELRDKLLPYKDKIILIRFGLEDMLRQLKMRRKCEDSIFDFSVTSTVLGNFIAVFKSMGFEISGGVYPCFKDVDGFKKDVFRDLKEGLFSKTIIHPSQIDIVNDLYKIDKIDLKEAEEICNIKETVFKQNSKMVETTTMFPHAEYIVKRAKIYGVK